MLGVLLLAACEDSGLSGGEYTVVVQVGEEQTVYTYDRQVTIGQFLQEKNIRFGDPDQINYPTNSQIKDGMKIKITRVTERTDCEEIVLPYETEMRRTQGLRPGETQLGQPGANGIGKVCYLVTEHNGVEVSRGEIKPRPNPIATPRPEIIYIGSEPMETLVPIKGVLAYISGGQAWVIRGNTANARSLTLDGRLDGRVFELSADGRRLLYTRRSTADDADPNFSNELWVIMDTTADVAKPVQLIPEDVRVAQWVPGRTAPTVSYSTATAKPDGTGWNAYNDLYLMQLEADDGTVVDIEELISPNALGIYADWGRRFEWSLDGSQLAWANANSVGLVNLEGGDTVFEQLLSFTEFETSFSRSWVWVPTLSWSEDGFLITTVHGPPFGTESPQDSIVFDLAVVNPASGLQVNPFTPQYPDFEASGLWANPVYSPMFEGPDGDPTYYVAYFQAREPYNSPSSEYDIVLADSDGSNPRVLFPGPDRPGLRGQDLARQDVVNSIAWSPDASKIAMIYQDNLWIVDVQTGVDYQITNDGQASRPRWMGD